MERRIFLVYLNFDSFFLIFFHPFDSLDDFNYPDMVSELSEISTFLSSSSFVEDLKQPKILWAGQYASILSILEEKVPDAQS